MFTEFINNHPMWNPYRESACGCPRCTRKAVKMIGLPQRGGNDNQTEKKGGAGACEFHLVHNEPYNAKNLIVIGDVKGNGFSHSAELENSYTNQYARIVLMFNSNLPTNDCTARGGEFKTAIYNGLNGFSKNCDTYETLLLNGDLESDDDCGTHYHIGAIHNNKHISMEEALPIIRRFYHSFFVELCDVIASDRNKAVSVFGRYFNSMAYMISYRTNEMDKYNFVNVRHDNTLEWRINKFISAEQYMKAVKLEVKFTEEILKASANIIALDNMGASAEAKKAEARKACDKMIALYNAI